MMSLNEMSAKSNQVSEEIVKVLEELSENLDFLLDQSIYEEFRDRAKLHEFQQYVIESEYLKYLQEVRSRY